MILLLFYVFGLFFVFFFEACGILAIPLGIEPTPPALEGEVLTTGLPEKSLIQEVLSKKKYQKGFRTLR